MSRRRAPLPEVSQTPRGRHAPGERKAAASAPVSSSHDGDDARPGRPTSPTRPGDAAHTAARPDCEAHPASAGGEGQPLGPTQTASESLPTAARLATSYKGRKCVTRAAPGIAVPPRSFRQARRSHASVVVARDRLCRWSEALGGGFCPAGTMGQQPAWC